MAASLASLFTASRALQSAKLLGISLVASAVLVGVGLVLFGIERHVAAIAAAARSRDGNSLRDLSMHIDRLVAYLLAASAVVCVALESLTYGIRERIGQGFAVFG